MSELFLKLLDMSLAATWLIAAVILVRLLLKKAPKWVRGILWGLVAIRLICPAFFESSLSLVPDMELAGNSVNDRAENAYIETDEATGEIVFVESKPVFDSSIETMSNTGETQNSPALRSNRLGWVVIDVAAVIWLTGMAALLVYALFSYLRLRRRVAAAMPMYENVRICDGIGSPFILGLFRSHIYLPSNITQEDMAYVLAHERAHLARRDHWWKPLGFVLLSVYWFNPLVWVAYILLCRDIELACDEKVIREVGEGEKKAYSEALLSCSVPRRVIAACPLAFGEVGVKSRIKSVLNYKKPAFWIIIVALVVCIALAVCFLTDPIKLAAAETEETLQYHNGMPLQELEIGEETVYPHPIVFFESGGWLDYQFTYGRSGLTVEYGLRSTDGVILTEKVEGGQGIGRIKDIPAGAYELFFRNCEDNIVAVEAENAVIGAFNFTCGGEYGFSERLVTPDGVFVSTSTLKLGKEIAVQFGNVPSDYAAYYNTAIEDAIGFYESIQVRKQLNLSYGDKVPTYFLSPDRETLVAVKQDKEGTNYSWTFVKNAAGEWTASEFRTKPSDHSVSTAGSADKPENVTVTAEDRSIGTSMKAAVEKVLAGKLPATICKMDPEGRVHPLAGRLDAWNCANAAGYGKGILSNTYQEVDTLETSEALITLEFAVDGIEWGITFYDGTDSVSVFNEGTEYLLQAAPDYEDIFLSPLGTLMRKWYDEAEYLFLCERVGIIPNTGQSYLEAAQEFCEAFEGVHLSVSPGSHYRYDEIFCRVEAAESATALFREQGEIGEDTYAFFVYTAFLPESERAQQHSIAGNTGPYEGNDPNVPKGVLEYTRCGYIALKDDGWHGIIAGTGF